MAIFSKLPILRQSIGFLKNNKVSDHVVHALKTNPELTLKKVFRGKFDEVLTVDRQDDNVRLFPSLGNARIVQHFGALKLETYLSISTKLNPLVSTCLTLNFFSEERKKPLPVVGLRSIIIGVMDKRQELKITNEGISSGSMNQSFQDLMMVAAMKIPDTFQEEPVEETFSTQFDGLYYSPFTLPFPCAIYHQQKGVDLLAFLLEHEVSQYVVADFTSFLSPAGLVPHGTRDFEFLGKLFTPTYLIGTQWLGWWSKAAAEEGLKMHALLEHFLGGLYTSVVCEVNKQISY